jgi:hypothetical protein
MKAAFCAIASSIGMALTARADTLQMEMICLSPQVFPATALSLGLEYRLSVSAFENPASVNHELATATVEHGFSHEGYFILEDPTTFEPFPLIFVLDIPPYEDADDNGIYDFYDRHWAVENVVTEGRHDNGFGGASAFTATWNRLAGDHAGTVTIDLPLLGLRFHHSFALLNFAGQASYVRDGTKRVVEAALTNLSDAGQGFSGAVTLRAGTAPAPALRFEALAHTWAGLGETSYRFELDELALSAYGTNFLAFGWFEDGQPATAEADYNAAVMIFQSPDANGNGVPDVLESGSDPLPRSTLKIERISAGVRITATGRPGGTAALESTADLGNGAWTAGQTLVLTNGQAVVTNSVSGAARFYRLRE